MKAWWNEQKYLFQVSLLLTLGLVFSVKWYITDLFFEQAVEIRKSDEGNGYTLVRHGKPYFIKGAGAFENFELLKEYGGNSIRTWNTDSAQQILDRAHELGLTVTLGLYMEPERLGFDYSDRKAVRKQFREIRSIVLKYRDHPALLMWGIGNELELHAENKRVWKAVNKIAKMIHEVDPNHPTTTMLAGIREKYVKQIKRMCPHIDILSLNVFRELPYVQEKLEKIGWDRPYMISEWGPIGYWESQPTSWGVFVEETSTEKAQGCMKRYKKAVLNDTKCIGSYVFLWGHKQERSHTYYSMFFESGEKTELVDVMKYLWQGTWPENRAPVIEPVKIFGCHQEDEILLAPDSWYTAYTEAKDPEGDFLVYHWEIFGEATNLGHGGDGEPKPPLIQGFYDKQGNELNFQTPHKEGSYRLFVYAYDGNGSVATANVPFYVGETVCAQNADGS